MNKAVKESNIEYDGFLAFIIRLVGNGTIDDVFNDSIYDSRMDAYNLGGEGISVSMLNDIKSNPDHYRQFIGTKK